jgi:integrase
MAVGKMAQHNKLSTRFVQSARKQGRFGDGNGLYLQVGPNGAKAWLFRYKIGGRARAMGLGPVSLVSLAQARERAVQARQALLAGSDPIAARIAAHNAARLQAARDVTFEQCAEQMMDSHQIAWRNLKHRAQWRATLATYAYPVFGSLPVRDINTAMVMKALLPIWKSKPETASRVRQRIERVLRWAKSIGYRDGDNPAAWEILRELLPEPGSVRSVRHHPAMPINALPAFMSELRGRDSLSARALEFTILTAARTGEVTGATWSEIDLDDAKVWSVQAGRMKNKKGHRVPLSDRAVELLRSLPRTSERVFPLSNMAMLQLLRGMRPQSGFVPHGFRSTFRDWCSERTSFPHEVVEAALAHVIADKTVAAYARSDLFERRRKLMSTWAEFCAAPTVAGERVVPLRA